MTPVGLLGVDTRVGWGLVAILAGVVLGRTLRWYGKRLDEKRPSEERELIITAFWSPKGYRRYSIELLTTDPDEAQRAIEDVGRRGPAGHARFLRPPRVVEVRERDDGTWLVRGSSSKCGSETTGRG